MKGKRERESDTVDMRGSEWISKQWINNWSYVIMWRLFYVEPQLTSSSSKDEKIIIFIENKHFFRERETLNVSEGDLQPPTKTNSRKVSSRCEFSRTVIMLCDMMCVCMCVCVCVLAMRRLNQITVKFILQEH